MGENKVNSDFNLLIQNLLSKSYNNLFEIIKNNFVKLKSINIVQYNIMVKFYNEIPYWGTINIEANDYSLMENNAKALLENTDEFNWLFNKLEDNRSRKTLYNLLTFWITFDKKNLHEIKDTIYNQYFDLDIISCDNNEIFIDVGGYIGDTILSYIHNFGKNNYKKIYSYEIIPANIEQIYKNIENLYLNNVYVKNNGVSDKSQVLYFSNNCISPVKKLSNKGEFPVNVVTLDKDIKDNVTFIKMDIEGFEELALMGTKEIIKKYHPKLAICIYHNNNQLWKIPKLIYEIDSSYKFYIRYYGGISIPGEYVLYAI